MLSLLYVKYGKAGLKDFEEMKASNGGLKMVQESVTS